MGYYIRDNVGVSARTPEPVCRFPQLSLSGLRYYRPGMGRWLSRDLITQPGSAAQDRLTTLVRRLIADTSITN